MFPMAELSKQREELNMLQDKNIYILYYHCEMINVIQYKKVYAFVAS